MPVDAISVCGGVTKGTEDESIPEKPNLAKVRDLDQDI